MKGLDATTKRLLSDPAGNYEKRRAWVIFQLRLAGSSLKQIGDKHGVHRTTVRGALIRTYPRMERLIAEELDLQPSELFPERYDDDGLPIYRMGRPKNNTNTTAKNTTRNSRRNVYAGGEG